MLLLYSFPLQVSHPIGIWKSCSPPQQDLCEQCRQISRLFASAARSDLWMRLCEACDRRWWRQAAAGLAVCGSSRGKRFEFILISYDFLVCFATFLSLILVCLFVWASLVLPSSQTLLISVSCRLGANRSSPLAPKISPAAWLLLCSVQALVSVLTTGPRAQRCSEFTWGARMAPSHLSPAAWADLPLQTGMRVPTREHLLPAWALLRVAGARWADAYGTHRGSFLCHRRVTGCWLLSSYPEAAWPHSKHPSLGLWEMVFPYWNLTNAALIWDVSDDREGVGIWGCLRNPKQTRSEIFFSSFCWKKISPW